MEKGPGRCHRGCFVLDTLAQLASRGVASQSRVVPQSGLPTQNTCPLGRGVQSGPWRRGSALSIGWSELGLSLRSGHIAVYELAGCPGYVVFTVLG
jgi:hypothetical protein